MLLQITDTIRRSKISDSRNVGMVCKDCMWVIAYITRMPVNMSTRKDVRERTFSHETNTRDK